MDLIKRVKSFSKLEQTKFTNLLESPRTKIAHIEFTSKCNLRCVFCYVSQPNYKGVDLDIETMESIIESLKSRNVKVVTVSGHGETTIYKNWNLLCNKMLDAGMHLHIISNFAKEFSQEELKTLSRFKSIEISCDTNDPELFGKLRRGADLKIICLNILRLRAIMIKVGRKTPSISLSCVVSDKNIVNLKEYVAFGKALGVNHFNFCNLTKYPDVQGALNVNHITEMPVDLLEKAQESLNETFKFLKDSNIEYHVQQGLLDTLEQKIKSLQEVNHNKGNSEEVMKIEEKNIQKKSEKMESIEDEFAPHRYSSSKKEGQTRDCLDPWEFVMVQANKDILPCCWHKPIYSLGKGQSLSEVFNNSKIKELRRGLLTGNLHSDCINCPSRGWITINALQKKVWKYLNPGIKRFMFPKKIEIKPDILKPFEVTYGQGWYRTETNLNIKDPDWQTWRWTAKKSVCILENPRRNALLIIRGSIDKKAHIDQKIIIKIKERVIDEFNPGTAKFFKEYVITPEMMGEDDNLSLIIETDKIFVPSALNPEIKDNRELGIQIYNLFFGEKLKE
jgi:MoaA/NifB/PqqE/SkfB family radical SAM enzyme